MICCRPTFLRYRAIIHALLCAVARLPVRQLFLVTFVCNTIKRKKRYVVETPSSSRSLGGDSHNQNQTVYRPIRSDKIQSKRARTCVWRSTSKIAVPPPKVVAPPPAPNDSVWSVVFWFRKIIKIIARSQLLRLCTKFYFGWGSGLRFRPTWES